MKIIAFVLSVLFINFTYSQDNNVAGVNNYYYPKVNTSDASEKLEYSETQVYLQMPVVLKKDKDYLFNKLQYTLLAPTLYHRIVDKSYNSTKRYHDISYILNWKHMFSPHFKMLLSLEPTLASDLTKKLVQKDFIIEYSGKLSYIFNQHLTVGLGAAYTTTFGKPSWVMLGEFIYTNNNFEISYLIPFKAYVGFKSDNKKWKYGLHAQSGGNSYNLHTFVVNNIDVDNVKYSRINVGPIVEYNAYKNMNFMFTAGVTTKRLLKFEFNDVLTRDYDANTGVYLGVGMYYTFK
ncbi:MAG: hypothetical protein RL662_1560 [Bacteroidota bacterium]|jgi:hypothetical protein